MNILFNLAIYFGYIWLSIIVFYTLYLAAINVWNDRASIGIAAKLFCAPAVLIMLTTDFLMQITLASVVFLDVPREFLVTQRLQRYRADAYPVGIRKNMATWICTKLLNPFDITRHHC